MNRNLAWGTGAAFLLLATAAAVQCGGDDSASGGGSAGATGSTSSGAGGNAGAGTSGPGATTGSGGAGNGGTSGGSSTSATGGGAGASGTGGRAGNGGSGGQATGGAGAGGGSGGSGSSRDGGMTGSQIQYVFIVLEENHDWAATKTLPYISRLLQIGAHSEQYYNPLLLHPSEPNYKWLEAGSNYGLTTDNDPSASNLITNRAHLSKLLDMAGISWMSYQESIAANTCPITSGNNYAAKHNPFVFFDDVSGNPPSSTSQHCRDHHKPFTQFLPDLMAGNVAHYNFITPNLQNDMHDGTPTQADNWLSANIDAIWNPANPNHNAAIYARSALFITWDEGTGVSDGPIGLIVVSPFAKVGFVDTNTPTAYYYTHSSTLLTFQKIFGVASTPLADAANARDLSALFTMFP